MIYNKIILILIGLIILILFIRLSNLFKDMPNTNVYELFTDSEKQDDMPNDTIPKKIWVFWDKSENEIPKLVKTCYNIISKLCPDYEFNKLNLENYKQFVDDERVIKIFENNDILLTQKTDVLRHYLMKKYGGFWLDSSIILLDNLDWIYELNSNNEYDNFMFYANHHTTNTEKPVLESWFIAAKPNDSFNTIVLDRLIDILNKPNLEMELDTLKTDKTVDYQNFLGHDTYHIVYFIYIETLFKNNISRMKFLDCSAYEYACLDCNGNTQKINDLFNEPADEEKYNSVIKSKLIKLTGYTRNNLSDIIPKNDSFMDKFYKKYDIY